MSAIVYRFRVIFEEVDDVERFIEIKAGQTFLELHQAIQDAIGFDNSKPASFYISGDSWRMGQEISTEEGRGVPMKDARLNQFVNDPHQRFIYVSDFESNWTLRVQLVKISKADNSEYPMLVKAKGEAPKQYKPVHVNDLNEFDELVSDYMVDVVPDGLEGGDLEDIEDGGVDDDDDSEADEFIEEDEI